MNDIILTILASVTVSSASSALIIWLSKTWITERVKNSIKHEYDLKLESFKATVEIEKISAIENIRNGLRVSSYEREIRFSSLHEKRSEVICDLHANLQNTIMYLKDYHNSEKNDESLNTLINELKGLLTFFRLNRVFLPDGIEDKVSDLCKELSNNTFLQEETSVHYEKRIRPLFSEIKKELKKMLGDEITDDA